MCAKLLLCLCASNRPAASAGSLRLSIWGSVLHIKDCLWSQGEGYWTSSRLRISKSPLISGFISTTGAVLPTTQLSPSGCALHNLQWAVAWSKSSKQKNHEFFQAAVELLSSSVEAVSRPVELCRALSRCRGLTLDTYGSCSQNVSVEVVLRLCRGVSRCRGRGSVPPRHRLCV